MTSRTASAAIALPLLAAVVWAGALWFTLVVAAKPVVEKPLVTVLVWRKAAR